MMASSHCRLSDFNIVTAKICDGWKNQAASGCATFRCWRIAARTSPASVNRPLSRSMTWNFTAIKRSLPLWGTAIPTGIPSYSITCFCMVVSLVRRVNLEVWGCHIQASHSLSQLKTTRTRGQRSVRCLRHMERCFNNINLSFAAGISIVILWTKARGYLTGLVKKSPSISLRPRLRKFIPHKLLEWNAVLECSASTQFQKFRHRLSWADMLCITTRAAFRAVDRTTQGKIIALRVRCARWTSKSIL